MPRTVDYPRKSLPQSLELAAAVDALGGSSSEDMAANRLGRKGGNSGAFSALIGAAVKYGLIEARRSVLSVTKVYRDYHLAYNDQQRIDALKTAFLNVALFRRVYDRFVGKPIPSDILDKLLIREFDVPPVLASRVGEYFLEGAQLAGLIGDGNVLRGEERAPDVAPIAGISPVADASAEEATAKGRFVIKIYGPGINSSVDIGNEDDLLIVDATLTKIRKALRAEEGSGT